MTVENPHLDTAHPERKKTLKLKKSASMASMVVSSLLVLIKFGAYLVTDSLSMMSSLMDSTFDLIASSLTMFSIVKAAMPADQQHQYGHGKIESLAAIGQATFILASAGYLFIESMHRFVNPQAIAKIDWGVAVMCVSIFMTFFLVMYQTRIISKTKSVAVKADYLHYKGDVLMNVAVIASMVASYYKGWIYLDPIFGTCVSMLLLHSSYSIFKEALGVLIDKEVSDEEREKIRGIIMGNPDVVSIHDLRTRDSGSHLFIEFHMEVNGDMSLKEAHAITEKIEVAIYEEFPRADVTIHQEPSGISDRRLEHKYQSV